MANQTQRSEAPAFRPLISVIIPALNEEAMIGKSLTALARAEEANLAEIIVVDNGSKDRTVEIAESFTNDLFLTVAQRAGVHVSALRNIGAHRAGGEILAFLDADCVVPVDWLVNVRRNMSVQSAGVVGGYIRIPENSGWVSRAWYGIGYAPQTGDVDYVPSGNLLIRRSQFLKLNGFDESLQTAEDFDLCLRARQAGLGVRAISELAVVHLRTPQTLRHFYVREKWHGAHVVKALSGNLGQWRRFRAIAFAVYTLICTIGVSSGAILALSGRTTILALAGAGGMLLAAAACTWKKLRVRGERRFSVFFQLTLLHVIYGLARARALVSLQSRYPRLNAVISPSHVGSEKL